MSCANRAFLQVASVVLIAQIASAVIADQSSLVPVDLRCEYGRAPLGIDTASPKLSWTLQATAKERGARQTAYQILVATDLQTLREDQGDLWDSGRVESTSTLHIPYDGAPLISSQRAFWKVRSWDQHELVSEWSSDSVWTMGVLNKEDWRGQWIVAPWESEGLIMRREFGVRPRLNRALVHFCGLGHFELTINGNRASGELLAPGWSKYNRTCLYRTYDITELLNDGVNVVGVTLGDGMYHVERRHRFSKFQGTFGPKRAIGQVELEYADGTREFLATDAQWRVNPGPVTYNDVFGGEDFDARKEPLGWRNAGFDDSHWEHAVMLVRPKGALRGFTASAPCLAAIEEFDAMSITALSDESAVIDLGQNASFMPKLTVKGPIGTTIRLTHAEVIHEDGTINRRTCGGNRGPAWWQFTKGTNHSETWFPKFFYAGCRYLQVDRMPAGSGTTLPELESLKGVVVHSTARPVGEFSCSNELLNRIRTLVRWAQRSNMVSVLTDCPHREKLGWLEQYHLNGPALRYEFDVPRIFNKGMRDMADSQLDDGLIPNIAPEYVEFPGTFRRAVEWGAAFIQVPWQQFQFSGDTSLMRDHYDGMKEYMTYLSSIATDHIIEEGLGDWYDLGPAERPGRAQLTPPNVTATAFYYLNARTMADIAAILGHEDDAREFKQLSEGIRAAWRSEFRNEDGTYATNSQCTNAIALVMDLATHADQETALAALVDDVVSRGHAMTAGDVGFRYLLQALAQGGRSDIIYKMINQDDRPGYGFQLKQGATSLTEAWDANTKASHNHFMLGHITEWFYKDLAGIDSDLQGPGFGKIILKPTPVGDLTWVRATYQSIRGPINVHWKRDQTQFSLECSIPANTTATVFLPAATADAVTEDGLPIAESSGLSLLRMEKECAVIRIDSGRYAFESRLPR